MDALEVARRFGHSMKRLRKQAGMNQDELAALIGRRRSTVASMEHGNQEIVLSVAVAVAEAFDTTVDEMVRGVACRHETIGLEPDGVWICVACGAEALVEFDDG